MINNKIKHRFFNKNREIARVNRDIKQQNLDDTAKILGVKAQNLITLTQVHSNKVVIVERAFAGDIPQADALVTQTPGLYLGILTADCVPILLAGKNPYVVAAVHAGWRGAVADIIDNTLSTMFSLGAQEIVAALGPCIWQESYEVSNEFYDQIDAPKFMKKYPSGHWHFDLPGYVAAQLLKTGVLHVEPSMANTYTDKNYNSYRRAGHNPEQELKSNLSVIGII